MTGFTLVPLNMYSNLYCAVQIRSHSGSCFILCFSNFISLYVGDESMTNDCGLFSYLCIYKFSRQWLNSLENCFTDRPM